MTALSADKTSMVKLGLPQLTIPLLMTASTTIWAGSLVSIVTATGLAVASADTAAHVFMGIAKKKVVSAATGDYFVEVETNGVFRLLSDLTVAQTHMGVKVVVKDSSIVTNAAGATNDIPVGIVVGIPLVGGSELDVLIEPAGGLGGSA